MKPQERIEKAIQEIRDFGLGEVIIKINRDGKTHIIMEKHTLNPTELDIEEALHNTRDYLFGGVSMTDAEWTLLKQTRSIRL